MILNWFDFHRLVKIISPIQNFEKDIIKYAILLCSSCELLPETPSGHAGVLFEGRIEHRDGTKTGVVGNGGDLLVVICRIFQPFFGIPDTTSCLLVTWMLEFR